MNDTVLGKIAASVQKRLDIRKELLGRDELEKRIDGARTPFSFRRAFPKNEMNAIAEIKFRSPALGTLKTVEEGTAIAIANEYLGAGARAISVLTEEDHFSGSPEYLRELRATYPGALLLMKDFIIDEYQILEARLNGADSILLIVSLLGLKKTEAYLAFAKTLGLSTLIEVHDEAELKGAISLNPDLVGINNRNLKTLEVSLDVSRNLIQTINPAIEIPLISESGIKTSAEVRELRELGFSGCLVGSSLMGTVAPGEALRTILSEAGTKS